MASLTLWYDANVDFFDKVDVGILALSTSDLLSPNIDRIPSTTPGAEPPRDAKDSGSARSHSTQLETSSSNRP